MINEDSDWGLEEPIFVALLPPRSRLVSLAPLGLGTAQVESLGSYYLRLADAHSLQPTTLAWEVVFPEKSGQSRKCEEGWKRPYFSGIGLPTQKWVSRLEELTKVDGLVSLTLGFMRERVSTLGLVCKSNRWCPICFQEDQEQGVPYGRLLWTFHAVTCCPKHRTKLIENCSCGGYIPRARTISKTLSNVCVNCSRDLGGAQIQHPKPADDDELRRAELVADLLFSGSGLAEQPRERGVADFLEDSIRFHFGGNAASLGQRLDISKSTLYGWIHRGHFPSFTQIIAIAESHGCSIEDVLCGQSDSLDLNALTKRVDRTKVRLSKCRRTLDWDAITEGLNEYLQMEPPLTMIEVGKRMGITPRTLRVNRPTICRAISGRWLDWRDARTNHLAYELEEEVRKVAQNLVEQGLPPTWRRIRERAASLKPGTRSTPRIAEICREARLNSEADQDMSGANPTRVTPHKNGPNRTRQYLLAHCQVQHGV